MAAKVSRHTNDGPLEGQLTGPMMEIPRSDLELLDTLRWVGKQIMVRNQNGKVSDRFCLICKNTKVRPMDCQHGKIWRLTGLARL